MMNDKILLFTDSFITGRGGVASYAHDFCAVFHSDYEIVVVTNDDYREEPYDCLKVIRLNDLDFSVKNANRLLSIVADEKPNIIINSGFYLLCLVVPYLPDEIKVVTISHFMDGKFALAAGFNGDYADEIISLSHYGKAWIAKRFLTIDKEKGCVIYNSIDSIDATAYAQKHKRRPLRIVYPGGHSEAKCAYTVGRMLKKLLRTDLDFEFYWTGNENLPGNSWPLVRTRRISDCIPKDARVKHIGSVNREENKELLASANIFLLPSVGEGCPITLLESMRAGCIPVIADAPHGSLDIVQEGGFGVVTKVKDSVDLFNAVSDILKNPEKYEQNYGQTIQFYHSKLTFEVWYEKMTQVLKSSVHHVSRHATINKKKYERDSRIINRYFKKLFLYDRIVCQPRTMIQYRLLRYWY